MNLFTTIKKNLNFSGFKSLMKAYTEGVYADTPANRKLGRVGMTYAAYAERLQRGEGIPKEDLEKKEFNEAKNRYNEIMNYIGVEHRTINTDQSDGEIKDIKDMVNECKHWLSYYYKDKNPRHELIKENTKVWYAETGRLKRFIEKYENYKTPEEKIKQGGSNRQIEEKKEELKQDIKRKEPKPYVEGTYVDSPANRKLGRVGMSYDEWDNIQKQLEKKKRINANLDSPQYSFVIPLKRELEQVKNRGTKIKKLTNGYQLVIHYDRNNDNYVIDYVTKNGSSKPFKNKDIDILAYDVNDYLKKNKIDFESNKLKEEKPAFTHPKNELSKKELDELNNYWNEDKNRSNPVIGNLMHGYGKYAYEETGSSIVSKTKRFFDEMGHVDGADNFFEDSRRYYNENFEDMSMEDFNKDLKRAIPKQFDTVAKKDCEESLFFGNLLRAQGDKIFGNQYNLRVRYKEPGGVGPKFNQRITSKIIKDDNGNITGIEVHNEIQNRRNRKTLLEEGTVVEGKTLNELSNNYFSAVSKYLQEANIDWDIRQDSVFYTSKDNNVSRRRIYNSYKKEKIW